VKLESADHKRFTFNSQPATGLEMIVLTVINTSLVIPNLVINVIIFVPAYAFVAWIVGLTPLGVWVAAGLKLLYINVQSDDLYKIGAAVAFVKSFLVSSNVISKEKNS
jgi:hypothetical protein